MSKPIDISNMPAELASVRKWMARSDPLPTVQPSDEESVIYARFSNRNQKEASIDRQRDVALEYAHQLKYRLRGEFLFADRGHTGDSLDNREALEELRRLARAGKFKRLLLYSWCRLSRRAGDAMTLFDEFTSLGIEVHVCAGNTTGRINHMQATMLSIFAMEERERLLRTTNYAAFAAAGRGHNMGGIPYGFEKGPKSGQLQIVPEKMDVVKRIFDLYVNHDMHPRKIAYLLNKDRIKGPRGGPWHKELISGNPGNGGGILRNPKYVGYLVYGVTTVVRTPGRAKTTRTAGCLDRLKQVHKPELACIDVDVFNAANAKLDATSTPLDAIQERTSKSILLLHGRYHCVCGSPMRLATALGKWGVRHLLCKAAFENGTCDRMRSTSSLYVEAEILREIRDHILSDDAVELFNRTYVDEMKRAFDEISTKRVRLTDQIAKIDTWLDNSFLESLREGRSTVQMARVCQRLNDEKAELGTELEGLILPEKVAEVPDVEVATLRGAIDSLIMRTPLADPDEADLKLVSALRNLVGKVVIDRAQGRTGYTLRIHAGLGALAAPFVASDPDAGHGIFVDRPIVIRPAPPTRVFTRDCPDPIRGDLAHSAPEKARRGAKMLATREGLTTEADWAAVEPTWRHWKYPDKRKILDATLFFIRTGTGSLRTLPFPFDGGYAVEYRVHEMFRNGCWTSAVMAMEWIRSPTVADLDLSRLPPRMTNPDGRHRSHKRGSPRRHSAKMRRQT